MVASKATKTYTIDGVNGAGKVAKQLTDEIVKAVAGGRFVSRTPGGAAKKAGTRVINALYPRSSKSKMPDSLEFVVTLRETTHGSGKTLRSYQIRRYLLTEAKVVNVKFTDGEGNTSNRAITYKYTTEAKALPRATSTEQADAAAQQVSAEAPVEATGKGKGKGKGKAKAAAVVGTETPKTKGKGRRPKVAAAPVEEAAAASTEVAASEAPEVTPAPTEVAPVEEVAAKKPRGRRPKVAVAPASTEVSAVAPVESVTPVAEVVVAAPVEQVTPVAEVAVPEPVVAVASASTDVSVAAPVEPVAIAKKTRKTKNTAVAASA